MTATSRPIIVSSIVPSGLPCRAAKILLGSAIDTLIATNQPLVIAVDDPLKQGPRQPTPAQTLANPGTRWGTIEVAWYDGGTRIFDAVSQTALWHRESVDPVPLRSRRAPGSNGEAETDGPGRSRSSGEPRAH